MEVIVTLIVIFFIYKILKTPKRKQSRKKQPKPKKTKVVINDDIRPSVINDKLINYDKPHNTKISLNTDFQSPKLDTNEKVISTLENNLSKKTNDRHINEYKTCSTDLSFNTNYQSPPLDADLQLKIKRLKTAIQNLENHLSEGTSEFIDKNYKINYRKELNPNQLEAASTINGKTLIIAGAGSGKTRTLTFRVSFLLENGIKDENILILTFTRKAADEIKKRVNQQLGAHTSNGITSGTFHFFCNMLLKHYSKQLGISPRFTILDQEDSRDLIDMLRTQILTETKEETAFPKKTQIQNIISSSRNRLIPIENIIEEDYPSYKIYIPDIMVLASQYKNYKQKSNLYDYDDLIEEINFHLKSNPIFKENIHKRYKYIMVDEYQDTNLPQKELIDLLAQKEDCSLMVVGDDNQSIYAFRGADYENILLFGETYPNAKLIKLEQNYRSTPNILEFINSLSDQISLGYKKHLFSNDKQKGVKPEFVRCTTEKQEAQFITDTIMKTKERLDYKEIAVLCRSSFHSNSVQIEFQQREIPFKVVGGIKFIEKRHIKDILAYLKILWNPLDAISWHRILTILDGIGKITANKITKEIQNEGGKLTPLKNSSYIKKNENIVTLYDTLTSANNTSSLIESFFIIEKYYSPILKKIEGDWENRIEDFKVVKRLCAEYRNIENLLSNLALDPPNERKGVFNNGKPDDDVVTISTIHSAKGLEWNTVFIISLIDGAVPHYRSFSDYEQLEEERKLFYVACSRAKENLYLTAPSYLLYYKHYFDNPSRFITEVAEKKYQYKEPI